MERVGLFIAGVQKAGTTSLDAYLRLHPDLIGPSVKETHVFDDETLDWSQPPDERLHAFYPPARRDELRFEATPITSFWPPALARVRRYNPHARIVIILRDPIERAWSQWCMQRHHGTEPLAFAEAIREGRRRLEAGAPESAWRLFSYVERGMYTAQIRRALMLFSDKQVLLLDHATLFRDVAGALRRIADFANIAPFPRVPHIRANSNPYPQDGPSPADIAYLRGVFAEDAREAVQLAGIEASHWPTLQDGPTLESSTMSWSGMR